ncbi:hypothetical protein IFM89_015708, partial [Coptis chinensis]
HNDVETILGDHNITPESESQLKLLLPQIVSSFSPDKSVAEIIEELKKRHRKQATMIWCIYKFL